MSIESSKTLGGVGAILMFIGIIPQINFLGVIEIAGLILVMVALYNFAGYYKERGIFNNALYGLIIGIVGFGISIAMMIIAVLTSLSDFLLAIYPDWNGDLGTLSGLTPNTANLNLGSILPFLTGILEVLAILWVFSIVAAFYIRRSLTALSAKSGVGLFSTAGLLMLIGAVLIIGLGIGLFLIWISAILLAIAFFLIRTQPIPPPPEPTLV